MSDSRTKEYAAAFLDGQGMQPELIEWTLANLDEKTMTVMADKWLVHAGVVRRRRQDGSEFDDYSTPAEWENIDVLERKRRVAQGPIPAGRTETMTYGRKPHWYQ